MKKKPNKVWIYTVRALAVIALLIFLFSGCSSVPGSLETPEGVETAAISLHTAELSWKEVERATAYEVSVIEARYAGATGAAEAAEAAGGTGAAEAAEVAENAGDTGANGTACQIIETDEAAASIQGLKAGTEYQATVTAIYEVDEDDKEDVCSEPSEPVTFVTETPQIGQVASVEAKAGGTSSVILSWQQYQEENTNADGSAPAVSYIVYYSDKESGSYEAVAEGITETSYTHTGLAAKTTGYYKVTAVVTMDEKDFEGPQPETPVSATTEAATYCGGQTGTAGSGTAGAGSSGDKSGQSSNAGLSSAQKQAQARAVAQQIAAGIGTQGTDLERVAKAAQAVSAYCSKATYTTEGSDYSQAYGVFIKGEYSCAGATRALGMVLEYMGYKWEHVNPNQWTHQWCKVTMDGQAGWADGQIGMAGYGEHPFV
ncbi:MAG TPA: hypothetical protein IAD16_04670 [Candidatus Fimisoma avicola]|uniref:Fibronectin type-III domain-containing protein n=1 Tax=Candidatus Fimisoma avicola TaxID=2840826 RepID=A0A9D1I3Q4_9FIRM|nr:hypothetical protein [Candidatus Fimisoma avicola]